MNKRKIIKNAGGILSSQAIAVFLALIISFPLAMLIKNTYILTVLTTLIYISTVYSAGWNEGIRDSRKVGESQPNIKAAIITSVIAAAVTLVLLIIRIVVYHIHPSDWAPYGTGFELVLTKSTALIVCDIIYRLWNYYFIGFLTGGTLLGYSIPVILPVIIYPIAYRVGLTRFSVIERYMPQLIYKPKKKKNNRR